MTAEVSPDTSLPSGDRVPWLVRVAERLSRGTRSDASTPLEKALWAMVLVQLAQMDTSNLAWALALVL